MIEQIATSLNLPVATVHLALVYAVAVAVAGVVIVKFWKIILIGGIAFACILSYVKSNGSPTLPITTQNVAAPVSTQPSMQDSIAGFSKAKSDFVNSCVEEGENNKGECVELWAEKKYEGAEQAGEAAENVAASENAVANVVASNTDSN